MGDNCRGLTFVVPAYNEESCIAATIERLSVTLAGLDLPSEVIVVNDGSSDGTGRVASGCDNITLINHPHNIGYGNSIIAGVLEARYAWIGIVDADGSYPIEDIPRLVAEMEKGYDMVVGSRVNISDHDSFIKRFFREIFKKTVSVLNDNRIEDPNSGLRIFKREVVLRLQPFLCGTFSFTTSISILMSGLYYFIKYVPITYQKRTGHSKVRHIRDSIQALQFILQGVEFFNPMKFFVILACLMLLLVYLPALLLHQLNYTTLAFYYTLFGTAVSLMLGMGALGDILRISSFKRIHDYK
jgi:glycosyltransferase involved in cell wall biosynthesis